MNAGDVVTLCVKYYRAATPFLQRTGIETRVAHHRSGIHDECVISGKFTNLRSLLMNAECTVIRAFIKYHLRLGLRMEKA